MNALPQLSFDLGCADCGADLSEIPSSPVPGGAICDPCALRAIVRLDRLKHAAGRAGALYVKRCQSIRRLARAQSLGEQWIDLKHRLKDIAL